MIIMIMIILTAVIILILIILVIIIRRVANIRVFGANNKVFAFANIRVRIPFDIRKNMNIRVFTYIRVFGIRDICVGFSKHPRTSKLVKRFPSYKG